MAEIVNTLSGRLKKDIGEISQLPPNATYNFDDITDLSKVRKTSIRKKVISKVYGQFQAREKVRDFPKNTGLSIIVPKSSNYAFDIISTVGIRSFIEGRKLSDVQEELQKELPHYRLPYSSLYDQQRKFLFYLGQLHQASMPLIKNYLESFGEISWLVDGTLEQGTDVFFGIKECRQDIMLDCYKIPTENEKDIARCLLDAGGNFGHPQRIAHDLSKPILNACNLAYKNVAQLICHSHFVKDVGKDLCDAPHDMLHKQMVKLKLKVHLKDQRKKHSKWFRDNIHDENKLFLESILQGIDIPKVDTQTYAYELFMALNYWMLDYADDGTRRGYPFDPYLLYFHRRSIKVYEAIQKILGVCDVETKMHRCLIYLSNKLHTYLNDTKIVEAANLYEKAFSIFTDIRDTLRMNNVSNPSSAIYESYDITSLEQKEISESITGLKKRLTKEKKLINSKNGEQEKKLYDIASKHIEKYEPFLSNVIVVDGKIIRTTNDLEQDWGGAKRIKRQVSGKKRLTREFNSLPKEYFLVQNLKNPNYVNLVLGSIEKLPEKMAQVSTNSVSFNSWSKKLNPQNMYRISKTTLRKDNFIENIVAKTPNYLECQ